VRQSNEANKKLAIEIEQLKKVVENFEYEKRTHHEQHVVEKDKIYAELIITRQKESESKVLSLYNPRPILKEPK
jgi:uridine kinase